MSGSLLQQAEELISITAREICRATGGQLLTGSGGAAFGCVSTDTRADLGGCLFVALKGDNFDGGDFGEEALKKGAAGVIAERAAADRIAAWLAASSRNGSRPPVMAAPDSRDALKKISTLVADRSAARVVAVTGSTGKTSTKDMLFALLAPRVNTIASRASFNNEVGVPLTLLQLEPDTGVAVVEMGMQAPGEIGELCRIVTPDIAIITNVGPAHLEYAGDLSSIARGKAEIAAGLPPEGGLVVPFGEKLLASFLTGVKARTVTFGFDPRADIHPLSHRHGEDGRLHCRLSCLGEEIDLDLGFAAHHHLLNLMAALGAYQLLGMPLAGVAGLAGDIHLAAMRGELIELADDVILLNDCYNANPLSMASSLDYLASVARGRRTVAVLGDMGELGGEAARYHREVGRLASELGIDVLIATGSLAEDYVTGAGEAGACAEEGACLYYRDRREAAAAVPSLIRPGDVVLVKASRFMKLEEISDAIIAAGGGAADAAEG